MSAPDVMSHYSTPTSSPLAFNGHYLRSCDKLQPTVDVTPPVESRKQLALDGLSDVFEGLTLSPKEQNDQGLVHRLRSSSRECITSPDARAKVTDGRHKSAVGRSSNYASQSIYDQYNPAQQSPTPASKLPSANNRRRSERLSGSPALKQSSRDSPLPGVATKQIGSSFADKLNTCISIEEILPDSEDLDDSTGDELSSDCFYGSEVDHDQSVAIYGSSATESDSEGTEESLKRTKKSLSHPLNIAKLPPCLSLSPLSTLIPEGPITPQQKIGFRGEQLVYNSLEKVVPGFGESHWTSNLRRYQPNMSPYGKAEQTDLQCVDPDGSLSQYLRNDAKGKVPKWLDDACIPGPDTPRPKYWIEVKTTLKDCETVFFVTKIQYRLMKKYRLRSKDMPANVYVLIRISHIDGKPDVNVYIDPWTQRDARFLTVVGYQMTTG